MRHRRWHRLTRVAALGLAAAAVYAPPGQARIAVHRDVGTIQAASVRPDDRAVRPGPPWTAAPAAAVGTRGGVDTRSGFDWGDAAVGFGAAIGVALLFGACLLAVRRTRKASVAV